MKYDVNSSGLFLDFSWAKGDTEVESLIRSHAFSFRLGDITGQSLPVLMVSKMDERLVG